MKKLILLGLITSLLSCNGGDSANKTKTENTNEMSKFYTFKTKTLYGEDFDFASLKGKNVLIVNTASECGRTPQYKYLQELYEKYGGDNFEILGFPANNFGKQEPGSNKEIAEFCEQNFGVTFTMMEKSDVIGENQNEIYQWLTQAALNGKRDAEVDWNFHKFLVGNNGDWVQSLPSSVSPLDPIIVGFSQVE